jgi:DNA invertase Pin-like site-specific DNA recombinase
MKTQQKNAIIYCRVNLHAKTDEILIIDKQESEVLKFCKNEGFNVIKKFTDYTTTSNKNQPEFKKMKAFAKHNDNQIDAVVCLGFDRIARTFEKAHNEFTEFNQMSIDIISVQQITNFKNNTNDKNN